MPLGLFEQYSMGVHAGTGVREWCAEVAKSGTAQQKLEAAMLAEACLAPPEAAGCESDCDSDCEAGAASADEAEQAEVEEGAQAPRAAKRRKTAADDEAAEATPDEGTADAQEEEEEIDSEMLTSARRCWIP